MAEKRKVRLFKQGAEQAYIWLDEHLYRRLRAGILIMCLVVMTLCLGGCDVAPEMIEDSRNTVVDKTLDESNNREGNEREEADQDTSNYEVMDYRAMVSNLATAPLEYEGQSYVVINGDVPLISEEIKAESYEEYHDLDALGRCTLAEAVLSKDTMPAEGEERGNISSVHPTGWKNNNRYDCVELESLFNRCHLIAHALGAENANERNLVTGTRYMNVEMNESENVVANYIDSTGHHVYYRVTPVFVGDELVCRGLLLEAKSLEDDTISICRYYFNVQPGISIDYADGNNEYTGVFQDTLSRAVIYKAETVNYILNVKSLKFHLPDCEHVAEISDSNRREFGGSREELIDKGYQPCGGCKP